MSIIKKPLRPGDDLDALLRGFFRSEMPHPWPALKLPVAVAPKTVRPLPARWTWSRSRWALAASLGLLLVGQLMLSSQFSEYSESKSDATFRPATADPHKVKVRSYKVEVEEQVGPDGKIVPRFTNHRIEVENGR